MSLTMLHVKPIAIFNSVEEVWFWTMKYRGEKRSDFERMHGPAPCEPSDIVKALGTLYTKNTLHFRHSHVLLRWGTARKRPVPSNTTPEQIKLWNEAMEALAIELRQQGWLKQEQPNV